MASRRPTIYRFILFFAIFFAGIQSNAQPFWKNLPIPGRSAATAICTQLDTFLIVGGVAGDSSFVGRFDQSGNPLWIKFIRGGAPTSDTVSALTCDSIGNIYGVTQGLRPTIFKLDSVGNLRWSIQENGGNDHIATSVYFADSVLWVGYGTLVDGKQSLLRIDANTGTILQSTRSEFTSTAGPTRHAKIFGWNNELWSAGRTGGVGTATNVCSISKYDSLGGLVNASQIIPNQNGVFSVGFNDVYILSSTVVAAAYWIETAAGSYRYRPGFCKTDVNNRAVNQIVEFSFAGYSNAWVKHVVPANYGYLLVGNAENDTTGREDIFFIELNGNGRFIRAYTTSSANEEGLTTIGNAQVVRLRNRIYMAARSTAAGIPVGVLADITDLRFSPCNQLDSTRVTAIYPNLALNNAITYQTATNGASFSAASLSTQTLPVVANPCNFSYNLGPDTTACKGDSVLIRINLPKPFNAYWYNKSYGDSVWAKAGDTVFVYLEKNCCFTRDTLFVKTRPNGPVLLPLPDEKICADTFTREITAVGNYTSILWSTLDTTKKITVTQPGDYIATVTRNGCTTRDTCTITKSIPPTLDTLVSDTSVCKSKPIDLIANGTFDRVQWSTNDTTRKITVGQQGKYIVTVFRNGCKVADTVNVTEKPAEEKVEPPTLFTPNGDGINDEWDLKMEGVVVTEVFVFNRWGQRVFHANDPTVFWDGKNLLGVAEEGLFQYIIFYRNECDEKKTGKKNGLLKIIK